LASGALAVVAAVLPLAGGTSVEASVTVDRPGSWPLTRLGAGELRVPVGREAEVSVPYRLPADASQGPHTWYLIRLHLRIAFARDSGPGVAEVSGLTDGHGAGTAVLRVRPVTEPGPRVRWETVDLVHGRRSGATNSHEVEIGFTNYVQVAGVRGGGNALTFRLEQFDRVRVARLVILPDSGLIVSHRGPAILRVHASPPTEDVIVGETFEVPFTVTNRGERPARNAGVGLLLPRRGVSVLGRGGRRLERIDTSHEVDGSFRLVASRPGDYQVALQAVGGANPTGGAVTVSVARAQGSSRRGALRIAIGSASLLAGLIAVGLSRKRKRVH
jgi:hypothetical protein